MIYLVADTHAIANRYAHDNFDPGKWRYILHKSHFGDLGPSDEVHILVGQRDTAEMESVIQELRLSHVVRKIQQ